MEIYSKDRSECHELLGAELEEESQADHCGSGATRTADSGVEMVEAKDRASARANTASRC